jgi:predicted TIM-barrel fold metal-dependent hydrolase
MGRGLAAPRFRWVTYVDALMLPLDTANARRVNPDYAAFYPPEERLLRRYLSDLKLSAVPATLAAYLAEVVTPTLERQKSGGALAVKFEAAYLRALDFAEADEAEAARVYGRYARGNGAPSVAEYKTLQDFLFRYLAREAGRLGLAVHVHTGVGVGGYYGIAGGNPMLLEPVFNDPALRKTNFVLIHGGWPFDEQTAALLGKPNVYADFSTQTLLRYPRELSRTIRHWLEYAPEKVLFATDAFALTPEVGWEEVGWLSARTGRAALALALTGMLQDGEITRARASELARMVLRENAARLYGMP